MKELQLSIIIPVYNVEEYLGECLDSVYMQNIKGCEVICANDGSTDNSRNILQEYQKKFKDLSIIDRKNGGLSAARNTGLKFTKGKFIYFLDSDDYLMPDALKKIIAFLENNSELDIACFNSFIGNNKKYFNSELNPGETFRGIEYYNTFYKVNHKFAPSPVWMYVYKKSFLDNSQLCFQEGIFHEDEHFTPKAMFMAQKVQYEDNPILFHRVYREGAITHKLKKKNLKDKLWVGNDLYSFFKRHNCTNDVFYHKTFEIFLSVAKYISVNKKEYPSKIIFTKNDFRNMKKCMTNWKEHILFLAFRTHKNIFNWYINDGKPKIIRTILNKIFMIYYEKCLTKNNKLT